MIAMPTRETIANGGTRPSEQQTSLLTQISFGKSKDWMHCSLDMGEEQAAWLTNGSGPPL